MSFRIMESGTLTDCRAEDGDDYDYTEPKTTVYILDTEEDRISDRTEKDIRGYFEMRCYCQHDCCGHRTGGVTSINRMYGHRYIITVHSSLNY
jgi:hypothetical protein